MGGTLVILLVQSVLSKVVDRMMMLVCILSRFIMNAENKDALLYFFSAYFPLDLNKMSIRLTVER